MNDIIFHSPAGFLIEAELDMALYMNLDPFEYFMEGARLDQAFQSVMDDFVHYMTPRETARTLLQFPLGLPVELKGIAV